MRLRFEENLPGIDAQDRFSFDDDSTPRAVTLEGRKAIGDTSPFKNPYRSLVPKLLRAASNLGSNCTKLSKKDDTFSEDGIIDSPYSAMTSVHASPDLPNSGVGREDIESKSASKRSITRRIRRVLGGIKHIRS